MSASLTIVVGANGAGGAQDVDGTAGGDTSVTAGTFTLKAYGGGGGAAGQGTNPGGAGGGGGVLGLLVLLLAIPHLLKVVTQLFRVKVLVNL